MATSRALKDAKGSGRLPHPAGARAHATGDRACNATPVHQISYDDVSPGVYTIRPKYQQANKELLFAVGYKPPRPQKYEQEHDPQKRTEIEARIPLQGTYMYLENETACGVHFMNAMKRKRLKRGDSGDADSDAAGGPTGSDPDLAGPAGGQRGGKQHDPADNRVFVALPDGIKWNRRRLFLCSDRLGLWQTEVPLGALVRRVDVEYVRPGTTPPKDKYFFSQVHGEDYMSLVDFYLNRPPRQSAGPKERAACERLQQLFGRGQQGGPGARGLPAAGANSGPSAGARPARARLPTQPPKPPASSESSAITLDSGDEDTGGEEGDVGPGPAGSEEQEDEDEEKDDDEEGSSDDGNCVQALRPGRSSGAAVDGRKGGAGQSAAAGAPGTAAVPHRTQHPRTALQDGQGIRNAFSKQQQQLQPQPQRKELQTVCKTAALALPRLGLMAKGKAALEATAYIYVPTYRTALSRVREDPLVVDGVQVPRADDPASRPLRKGDKVVMHVCCGMGGASLHGRVNVQEEREKAVEERLKLQERKELQEREKTQDGLAGGSRSGEAAGPGGSGVGAGPSGSGTGASTAPVGAAGGSMAGSAAPGGNKGAEEVAEGCSGEGGRDGQVRVEQGDVAGRQNEEESCVEDSLDERPCKRPRVGTVHGGSSMGAGTPAPPSNTAAEGAGPSGQGPVPPPGLQPPAAGVGDSGSGSGSGTCGDGQGHPERSGPVEYSGVVTAVRNRAEASAAAVAAAGEGVGVPLESIMKDIPTDDEGCIRLVNAYASDIDRSALQTFLANNPAVGLLCRATELNLLLRLYAKLVEWAEPARAALEAEDAEEEDAPNSPSPRGRAGEQQQQQAKAKAAKGAKKGAKASMDWVVADVLCMRLCHAVPKDKNGQLVLGERELAARDCWLEFLVEWEYAEGWDNYPEGRYQWLRLEELGGCTLLLARFVRRLRGEGWLPLPGGVDCLVAGPPCQHMSGLNRHANKIEVMKDAKNRIVLSVLSIVEHLRPPFALLEQVVDAGKKDAAVWLRTVQGTYMELGYQQRTGLIFAGSFAPPQARPRLFVWAADTGYVLPAFPRPTHEKNHLPDSHLRVLSVLEFCYVVAGKDAELLPGSVLGDVLAGLEDVDNWRMAAMAEARGVPQNVLQHLLSRPPPDSTCSAEERTAAYLGLTAPVQIELALAVREVHVAFVQKMRERVSDPRARRELEKEVKGARARQPARQAQGQGQAAGSGAARAGAAAAVTDEDLEQYIAHRAAVYLGKTILDQYPKKGRPKEVSGSEVLEKDREELEANAELVQDLLETAQGALGQRVLENAQGALLQIEQLAGPALEHLRAMLAACEGKQVVGSAGQEAVVAGDGGAQGQAGGNAGRRADGTAPASSRGVEAAAGRAAAAPGGSGGGGDGDGGGGGGGSGTGPAAAWLGGLMTNHIPAMLTPTEEHRVMCVPPHTDDPKGDRPSFRNMRGPYEGHSIAALWDRTALLEPLMTATVRNSKPSCTTTTCYGRWGPDEVIHTQQGCCLPASKCVLHPEAHRTLTMREELSVHTFPYYYVLTAYEGLFCRTGEHQGVLSRRDAVLGPAVEGLEWAARAVGVEGAGAGAAGATRSGGGGGAAAPGGGTARAGGHAAVPPLAMAAGTRKSAYRKLTVDVGTGAAGAGGQATGAPMTRLKDALQRLPRLGAKMQKQIGDSVCPLVAEGLSRELLRAASLAVEDGGRSGLGPEWSAGLGASKAVREAWEWRCERPEERMGGRERSNGEGLVKGGEGEQEDEERLKVVWDVREPGEDLDGEGSEDSEEAVGQEE